MKKKSIIALILSILLAEGLGFLSSVFAGDIRAKYEMMNKPPFSPPGQVFGIAWALLYLLMAIAAFLVYRSYVTNRTGGSALVLYCMQLLVNFAWSIVFFRADQYWIAFAIIALLDLLVIFCVERFFSISKGAGWLMIPYFLWLVFATYLNVGFAILN